MSDNPLVDMGVKLTEIVATNTWDIVATKIETAKAKKNDKDTIEVLSGIVNDLMADKTELVQISRIYQDELGMQNISDMDIEFITTNLVPFLEMLMDAGANAKDKTPEEVEQAKNTNQAMIAMVKKLLSPELFKIMQMLGFNFKEAIGEPLTNIVSSKIEGLNKHSKNSKKK